MIKNFAAVRKIILSIVMVLILAACSRDGDVCVYADDFGDLIKKDVNIYPSGEWIAAGVTVQKNKSLNIKASSSVGMCGSTVVQFSPKAGNGNWQYSGVVLPNQLSEFGMAVSGNYSAWKNNLSCIIAGSNSYWNNQCVSKQGRSLYAFIGDTPPDSKVSYNAGHEDHPEFFELYDHQNNQSGFDKLQTPASGKIWFRYRDTSTEEAGGDKNIWEGDYSDNRYGYTVNITIRNNCMGSNGQYMIAYIGNGAPSNTFPESQSDFSPDSLGDGYIDMTKYAFVKDDSDQLTGFNDVSPSDGQLYFKIIDSKNEYWSGQNAQPNGYKADGNYTNNDGNYIVHITTVKPPSYGFSNFINQIIDPVRNLLMGQDGQSGILERAFNNITSDGAFVSAIRALLAMSIAFLGLQYMLGLNSITLDKFVKIAFRMGVLVALIGPDSWQFFYDNLFVFFIKGTDELIWIMSSQLSGVIDGVNLSGNSADTFAFLNQTIIRFFTVETNDKIRGVFSAFPLGIIYGILIYIGVFYFLYTIAKAVLTYIVSIVMTAMLLFIAPIAISFIMFERTKSIFDTWIRMLMSFALQPIFIFSVLSIFNAFIYSAFYNLLAFDVCWGCIFTIDLPFSEAINSASNYVGGGNLTSDWDKICLMQSYKPWGYDSTQGLGARLYHSPVPLFMILIFLLLVHAMAEFIDWAVALANNLTVGVADVGLNVAATSIMRNTATTAKLTAKGIDNLSSIPGNMVNRDTRITDVAKKAIRRRLPSSMTHLEGGAGKVKDSLLTSREIAAKERGDSGVEALMTKSQKAKGKIKVKDENKKKD